MSESDSGTPKAASTKGVSTKGKAKKQAAATNAQIQNALYHYYNTHLHPVNIADQRFRFTAYQRQRQKTLPLNGFINQMQWQDLSGQAWLQGSFTLRAVAHVKEHFTIGHGDVVRAEVWWNRGWRYLWDMRIWDPDRALSAGNPSLTGNLYDDLYLLSLSEDDFHYNNVFCHEVLLRVCERYKIPVGQVAMGKWKIKNFDEKAISPIDAIILAYKQERNHTGHRFVIRWLKNRLHVIPLQKNPLLYTMSDQLVNATLHHITPDTFATAVTARTSSPVQGGKGKRVTKGVVSIIQGVDAYGYIHKQSSYSQHYTDAQLRTTVKHELAKRQIVDRTIDFDHEGIALVRKGDAIKLPIPDVGYTGAKSIFWIKDITHTVQPGVYTMSPTVSAIAPIGIPDLVTISKAKTKRATKRKTRKRSSKKTTKFYTGSSKGSPDSPAPVFTQLLSGGSGP